VTSNSVQLIDHILDEYRGVIGDDYTGYRNHVCRMVSFCFVLGADDAEARQKIIIAGSFHDIGIWTANTFDYLLPSIEAANRYLERQGLAAWSEEIAKLIGEHHKLRRVSDNDGRLVEIFRKGDLVDFSLGFLKCGVPTHIVKAVKAEFPNEGFHKSLINLAGRWFCRHPLNPIPVLKW
jgi:hypothetical protein